MRHWWLAVGIGSCVLLGCVGQRQSDLQPQGLTSSPHRSVEISAMEAEKIIDTQAIEAACWDDKPSSYLRDSHKRCIAEQVAKMPMLDPNRRDQFGVEYNPQEYLCCKSKRQHWGDYGCEYLILRRHPQPEYWPYPEVAKPKLPEAPQPPVYREGMSAEEYFRALCKAEAGEFIYRVVENVEGLYQIRPRRQAGYGVMTDLYVLEDPYGYTDWEADALDVAKIFVRPPRATYRFLERPMSALPSRMKADATASFVRESGYAQDKSPMQREFVSQLKSRYGYTWREIKRPKDRELGISGGELIVVDLQTKEVLGIRRGFARTGIYSHRIGMANWEGTENCPSYPGRWSKDSNFSYWFISKVLKPAE